MKTWPFFVVLKLIILKYTRLTKEQLEELHPEFINFLSTQSITGDEWSEIKSERPAVAEEQIDIFSDLIWEGVLQRVQFLEKIEPHQMHLFATEEKQMRLISVRLRQPEIDLTTADGFAWFKKNYLADSVEYLTASKSYGEEPKSDIFELIQQGAVITKGELFNWFDEIIQ